MKLQPEQIGFDIDGVVADTMEAFIRIAFEEHGVRVLPEEITEFMVEDCLDMDPGTIDEIFARLLHDPIGSGLEPMENALPVLERFAREGALTFITARPEAGPIDRWLRLNLSPSAYRAARLVATGDHDEKTGHIRAMGLSHFIDDRAITCNLLARESDITPIVYSQPWNRGRHSLPSVDSWHGIDALCRNDRTTCRPEPEHDLPQMR